MTHALNTAVAVEVRAMDDLFRSLIGEAPVEHKTCEICGRKPRFGFLDNVDMCIECGDLADLEDRAYEFGVDSLTAEDRARCKSLAQVIRKTGGKPEFDFPALLK